jgi:hypothetical protein
MTNAGHWPSTALSQCIFLAIAVPATLAAQSPSSVPASAGSTLTAPSLSVGEKFTYHVAHSFGVGAFLGVGVSAGVSQATNTPSEWGQGGEGFARRVGSAFGVTLSRNAMGFVLDSALREDPRYFPSREKGFGRRLGNVLRQTFIARTDSGRDRFAFSRFGSAFAAGQLANAWEPRSNGHVEDGLVRGCISIGGDAALNFLEEFIPFLRPHELRHP